VERYVLRVGGQDMSDRRAKMYIKDVKSSNGTFVNGERLSLEGVESDPFELKSEDTVVSLSIMSSTDLVGIRYRYHQR
jgi:pSer/pThr/pTyr-binding forkhead associated (FHA) protein